MLKTNTKPLCKLFYTVRKHIEVTTKVNFLKTMFALMTLSLRHANIWQSNFHWNIAFYNRNRNMFLTSDTDISSRWIPSKHFQVTDIFNVKLLCLTKTGFCQISVTIKNILRQIIQNTQSNMWFENKSILTWQNLHFI